MKNCLHCVHAAWRRNTAGALHPSGDGTCTYEYRTPPLPQSMYWSAGTAKPVGGYINRKIELDDHCVYWALSKKGSK